MVSNSRINRRTLILPVLILVLAAALVLSISHGKGNDYYIRITGYAQGGQYSVTMNMAGVSMKPEEIKHRVDSILARIDNSVSGYNKSSLLSRFNSGVTVMADSIFAEMYNVSRGFWEQTGGAIDVAAGPLFDIWGFGFTEGRMPDDSTVAATRDNCGMKWLVESISASDSISPAGMLADSTHLAMPVLNFNAVAQGYSCDLVAAFLKSIGTEDMLVDIGEIWCCGVNPDGKPWTIAVDRPADGNNTPGADTDGIWQGNGSACGIVTSGNYRKYYISDGKKLAHTIDPRTGRPVEHTLLSATVLAPDAAAADAYATYCMVIGLEEAKEFITGAPELEGYLIYDEGGQMQEWTSPGFNLISKGGDGSQNR